MIPLPYVGYLVVFGASAVACFLSIHPLRDISDPETRRGLIALLATSGGWATAHVAFLLAPTRGLKIGFYVVGLIVGLGAVGPWLYFCSAYTGRTLHRNSTYQWAAVAVFLGIVLVKVTNPLHHLYFTTAVATTPFPHVAVQHQVVHWVVMGLSYGLAMVGYFMLFERFTQVSFDTGPLAGLAAVTGLPLVLDVVGFASPILIDITYEPIGVAVFAVGVAYLYLDQFQAVQLTSDREDPTIVLDDEDCIREYNANAASLFPELGHENVLNDPIAARLPSLAEFLDADAGILSLTRGGDTRYYRVSVNSFASGQRRMGRLVTLTDITHRERYRKELERQNQRLEEFASILSHDLRNPLNVAQGRLELAEETRDWSHLHAATDALDRMEELIEDVLSLARQGQPIDDLEEVTLSVVAERAWESITATDADMEITGELTFQADESRLRQLFENLFRNAIEHGGSGVTIRVGVLEEPSGFYVADDGVGIPEDDRGDVFDFGYTTADEGTGFGLAIVKEIVDAHGWSITVSERSLGGARFDITDVGRSE